MCKVSADLVQLTYMFGKSPPIPELEVQYIAAKVMLYCGQGRHGRRTRQKQTIGSDAEAAGGDACIARKLICTCTPTTVSFASQEQQRQLEERAAGIKSVRVQTTAVFFVLASGMSGSVSTTHER